MIATRRWWCCCSWWWFRWLLVMIGGRSYLRWFLIYIVGLVLFQLANRARFWLRPCDDTCEVFFKSNLNRHLPILRSTTVWGSWHCLQPLALNQALTRRKLSLARPLQFLRRCSRLQISVKASLWEYGAHTPKRMLLMSLVSFRFISLHLVA